MNPSSFLNRCDSLRNVCENLFPWSTISTIYCQHFWEPFMELEILKMKTSKSTFIWIKLPCKIQFLYFQWIPSYLMVSLNGKERVNFIRIVDYNFIESNYRVESTSFILSECSGESWGRFVSFSALNSEGIPLTICNVKVLTNQLPVNASKVTSFWS